MVGGMTDVTLEPTGWPEPRPGCVAPGCVDPGPVVFTVATDPLRPPPEGGWRFAGRAWQPGDEIRLCRRHAGDVYHTQGAWYPEEVADWLRPDAADPPNTWLGPRHDWTEQELAEWTARRGHTRIAWTRW
jgi:hypothetical protein